MQTGSEGCLLLSSTLQNVSGKSEVQMERKFIPISLPVFWSWSSTKNIHKTTKNTNRIDEKVERASHNLSRRHFDTCSFPSRTSPSPRHFDFCLTEPRISDQLKEISVSTLPKNSIFRVGDRFLEKCH